MIQELLDRRLILVTGKGGVGKTTVSTALALVASRAGKKVVVCEVEGPSAVAPLLGSREGGHEPRPIGQGIHLAVLCPEEGIRTYLAEKIRVPGLVDLVFKQQVVSRFFRAAPAFAEMGVLYAISRLLEATEGGRPKWDHVIVDLPASGHAVGMLEAPFIGKKIFVTGPVRALCESIEKILIDHRLSACAVVTLPEELPVNEALELSERLKKRGLHVQGVIANAVEGRPLDPREEELVERLHLARSQPFLEAALSAAKRAGRASETLGRLRDGIRTEPLPISFRLERGGDLVREIAAELEGHRPIPGPESGQAP